MSSPPAPPNKRYGVQADPQIPAAKGGNAPLPLDPIVAPPAFFQRPLTTKRTENYNYTLIYKYKPHIQYNTAVQGAFKTCIRSP